METTTMNPWLGPAVVIAVIGLLLQGFKAAWDLWFAVRNYKRSAEAGALQRLSTFLVVVDGLSLSEAEKTTLKMNLTEATISSNNEDLMFLLRNYLQKRNE